MSSIVYVIFQKCYLNQAKPGSRPLEIECVLKSCLKYTKATEHVATWVRNEKRCVFFLVLWSDFAFTPVRAFSTLYLEKRLRASFPLKTNFWQKLTRSKWRCGNVSDLDQTLWKFRIETLPESAGLALPRFLVLIAFDLRNRFASSVLTGGCKGSGIVHVYPALQPAWTSGNTTKIDPPALFFRSSCLGRWPTRLQEKESRPHVELLKIIGNWGGDWRGGDGCLDMLIQYVNTRAA